MQCGSIVGCVEQVDKDLNEKSLGAAQEALKRWNGLGIKTDKWQLISPHCWAGFMSLEPAHNIGCDQCNCQELPDVDLIGFAVSQLPGLLGQAAAQWILRKDHN